MHPSVHARATPAKPALIVAETGAEGSAKAPWLHYVSAEVRAARAAGAPVEGICLYPVTDYPGWDCGRTCPTGLFGMAEDGGARPVDAALDEELRRQAALFAGAERLRIAA